MARFEYDILDYRVIDGDTIETLLDQGFNARIDLSARLDGIDTPERGTVAGKLVKEFVVKWMAAQKNTVRSISVAKDKYEGRYLARIVGDTQCLNEVLVVKNMARPYTGGKRDGWQVNDLKRIEKAAQKSLLELSK